MNVADNALEFWLSSLNMSCYYQTFIDNGYDDLEISKKIGASDLTAMGITLTAHRMRILQAVTDLVIGGATQVYIRAASLHWQVLKNEEKRDLPRNLLRKMLKMKIQSDGVSLADYSPLPHKDIIPLSLVYMSHRYSLSLTTHQDNIEKVIEELWREALDKELSIQAESPYENFEQKTPSLFSTFQHSRLNTNAYPRSISAQQFTNIHPLQKISGPRIQQRHPRQQRKSTNRSSECSPSSSSPATSSDYEYPRLSCLSSSRLQDSSISTSSSVDSLSCLLTSFKMKQQPTASTMKHSETSVDSFKKQFERVKSHSKLVNSGKIYCVDTQLEQKLW